MQNINFSALATVYHKDNPQFLKEALDSIVNQTRIPSEIVIVADGPLNMDLDKILNEFKSNYFYITKLIYLPRNIGTGKAINEGLKQCSYDLVAKIDSDDISFPTRFEKQLDVYEKNPELAFVSASICEFKNNDIHNISSYRVLPEKHGAIIKYAKRRCPMNQPAAMYRKSAIFDCGGYNNFTFGEDYDLWVRAIMKGYKFYNIQEPLLYFRTNEDSIKKRGGFWYLKIDMAHHYDFYKMGFLTFPQFVYNCAIRFVVRLIPIKLRQMVYSKLLRKKNSFINY
ncbi:glycosyltransferase [Viscerimonas tarda]